jgi:hypothetical protein
MPLPQAEHLYRVCIVVLPHSFLRSLYSLGCSITCSTCTMHPFVINVCLLFPNHHWGPMCGKGTQFSASHKRGRKASIEIKTCTIPDGWCSGWSSERSPGFFMLKRVPQPPCWETKRIMKTRWMELCHLHTFSWPDTQNIILHHFYLNICN